MKKNLRYLLILYKLLYEICSKDIVEGKYKEFMDISVVSFYKIKFVDAKSIYNSFVIRKIVNLAKDITSFKDYLVNEAKINVEKVNF